MSNLVVEIHVPLIPAADVADGEYGFCCIHEVEERIAALEGPGDLDGGLDGRLDRGQVVLVVDADRPGGQVGPAQAALVRAVDE